MHMTNRANRKVMRAMNIKLVLDTIRREEPIAQVDLVDKTKLSVGTIVSIVRDLKDKDLLHEVGPGESKVGRKPVMLQINRQALYVVGAMVEPQELVLAILDIGSGIVNREKIQFGERIDEDSFVTLLKSAYRGLMKSTRIAIRRIVGLGLSLPVSAGPDGHFLMPTAKSPGPSLKDRLEKELKLPVFTETTVRAITLGELRWGKGKGFADFILIDADVELNLAVVMRGEIIQSDGSRTGDLGGLRVLEGLRPDQVRAPIVSLGELAAGRSIVTNFLSKIDSYHSLPSRTSFDELLEFFYTELEAGNPEAERIFHVAVDRLGLVLANIIGLFHIGTVLFTGRMVSAGQDRFVRDVYDAVVYYLPEDDRGAFTTYETDLREEAGILGAAAPVFDALFSLDDSGIKHQLFW
jgi:predicted NBD/HSP70 family sugar kinase